MNSVHPGMYVCETTLTLARLRVSLTVVLSIPYDPVPIHSVTAVYHLLSQVHNPQLEKPWSVLAKFWFPPCALKHPQEGLIPQSLSLLHSQLPSLGTCEEWIL